MLNGRQVVNPKKEFMLMAIGEARTARRNGDCAIGSILVQGNKVIAKSGNRMRRDNDPSGHAEILVIREACKILERRFLEDCILYSTHEHCPMCACAIVWAKIRIVVFGAFQEDMRKFSQRRSSDATFIWRTRWRWPIKAMFL